MKFDLAAWGAELTPDRPAIWFGGRWYSYRDLNERATRLANHLASLGVEFGDRIGILSPNHLAHFDLFFAAPKLGFILAPFNYRLSVGELREQVGIVRPALVFCDTSCNTLARNVFICRRVMLDDYRTWLGHSSRLGVAPPELSPESIQMILFTGGGSGTVKAVLIPYRQTLANARGTAVGWNLGAEDCAIQATPCFHAGFNVLSTPLLTLGGRIVLMSQFEPGEYLHQLQHLRATVMYMLPDMYQALAAHPDFAAAEFGTVRWAISGGAPCPPELSQAYAARGICLKQGYGVTEAGVNCFAIDDGEARRHPDSVGRPMPHIEAAIRRTDGSLCDDDELGELSLAGDAICSGYLNSAEEWQLACRDGWFRTGDLALRDAEGRFYIRGRRQEVFISGGRIVFPAEVEAAITQCAGVAECAVLGIPDATLGESGLAAVVMKPGVPRDAGLLRRDLRDRIADEKLPAVVVFVDELPRTTAGKINRTELRWRLEDDET